METKNSILDKERTQRLLRDFHKLTGIKVLIYDQEGEEISFYPKRLSAYCEKLREDDAQNARCVACDRCAVLNCRKSKKTELYTCHAGLYECIVPIAVEGAILGFIGIGQIRGEDSDRETALRGTEGERRRALEAAYNELPVMEKEKIEAAAHILRVCAGYEELKQQLREAQMRPEEQLDRYIAAHIGEDLGVEALRAALNCSRRELYRILRTAYGCTPGELIRRRKLERACLLLETTSLPITEVADACGITDYNYFSKIFKQSEGVSPREYRKKKA
jgi:AraC-like DNA-binding protein